MFASASMPATVFRIPLPNCAGRHVGGQSRAGGSTESAVMVIRSRVSGTPRKLGQERPRYVCEISSMLSAAPSVVVSTTRPRTP